MTAQLYEPQVRATDSATVAVVFVVVVPPVVVAPVVVAPVVVVAVAVALFYSRSLVRGLGLPIIAVVARRLLLLLLLISLRGTPSFTQLINWRGFSHARYTLPTCCARCHCHCHCRVESGPKCLLRGAFQLDWLAGPLWGDIYDVCSVYGRSIYRFYSCTSDRSTNLWSLPPPVPLDFCILK